MRKQQKAKDAVQALLPIGIGAEGGNFNKIYRDTFTRIVRNGENIQTVLNEQGALLQADLRQDGRAVLGARPAERKGSLQGEVENPRRRQRTRRVTSIASKETVLTRRARRWEGLLPYWLILPTVAYLGLFFVWPMIQGFGLALRDETGTGPRARSTRWSTTRHSTRRSGSRSS